MLLIGLTGGIGSGKSTVAGLLAERGAVIVDADRLAREVVEPGRPAYQALVERFGSGIVRPDGALDRSALAAVVFNDAQALEDLNKITHPAIQALMAERVEVHRGSDSVVVLDIPLLAAVTRDRFALDGVVVVDVPEELAVQRLVDQRGMAEADARARIAAQQTRAERRAIADMVIDNSGSPEDLQERVGTVWRWITGLRPGAVAAG